MASRWREAQVKAFWTFLAEHPGATEGELRERFGGRTPTLRRQQIVYDALVHAVRGVPVRACYGYGVTARTVERRLPVYHEWLLTNGPGESARREDGTRVAYPPGHLGALLQVRDTLSFPVPLPWFVLPSYFYEPELEHDPPGADHDSEDESVGMLRAHSAGHPFWEACSAWNRDITDYQMQARALVAAIETYALQETGLARAYSEHGGESFSPQHPPSILKWSILGPMDYLLRTMAGTSAGRWQFRVVPFGPGTDPSPCKLEAGSPSQMQTIAVGRAEQLAHVEVVERHILAALREPSALPALVAHFEQCQQTAQQVQVLRDRLTEAVFRRGHCWACPPQGNPAQV
jgi:hypothetical protein